MGGSLRSAVRLPACTEPSSPDVWAVLWKIHLASVRGWLQPSRNFPDTEMVAEKPVVSGFWRVKRAILT